MPAAELRAEIVQWLRSFTGELTSDGFEELRENIHAEFVAATAIFGMRENFFAQLAKLGQAPVHHWADEVQSWRPRPLRLDWYTADDSEPAPL